MECTVNTHDYGFNQPGSVNHTFLMLTGYYQSIGLYSSSSSLENEENDEENEGESASPNELSNYGDISANSSPSAVNESATPAIDMKQFLVASTSDIERSEIISTDMELWSTSESSLSPSSSLHTTTSEYSGVTLPSYADLLDYSPSKVEQPQPTDAILVPRECVFDVKLRCPPDMEITRLPILEQAISSLWDHCPPNINEDVDIQVINTSPECIEISSDSDVVILE